MLFLAGFLALSCDNSCCAEEAPEVKEKVTLTGVSVVSNPTKMIYVAGEKFEPAGMQVKAHYSDGKEKELKDGEYTYSPVGALTENNTNITVSYTEDGVKKETAVSIKMGYNITVAKCENGTVECALERAEEKTRINVTATADKGYYLTSLSYKYYDSQNKPIVFNLEVGEGVTEYSFDMPSYDITIEAVFSEDPTPRYSIELNKTGEKDQAVVTFIYGSVNSEEVVQKDIFEGTEITFTVSPNSEDYYVPEIPQIAYDGETEDVEVVDLNTGKYKFTMPGANVVVNVAIAEWGTYKLSTIVNGGKGTVKLTATADGKEIVGDTFLAVGTEIKAVVTPADDYEISFVKFNSEVLDADDDGSYTFKMGEENAALEVMFAEIQGNEVVQGAVVNGKLEISHVLAKPETNVTITAIPDEGYVAVESLTVTTADSAATEIPYQKVSESGNVYSFVMPESAVTVSAVFRGYLVTVNTSENGKVTADVASAKAGDKITLTAIAKEKNALGTISVKAGEDSLKNTRTDLESGKAEITFTMPASDVEIDATFDKAVSVTAGYTPEKAGLIELYQGKTYITLGNTMYFANGTELTLETTPGTIGDGIYEVGAVKAIAANDQSSLNLVTEVTANEEYKIVVEDRNFEILVEFTLSNAKRVFINKEGLVGGTVVVEDNRTTVTSSSDSWLGGDAYIIDGHTVTVKATADVGYAVGTIKWNGKTITNGGTFTMPKEPVEITATFEKDSYPLNFKSSVANGTFTLSSDFTFDETTKKLSPAGKTYGNGDKVPYKEIVYIIATPSNSDYMEQITVMNETDGQAIKLDRLDKVSKPYQFEMPASASGVTADVYFEFAGSDVNLWVNGKPVSSFYLNPTPDKSTWGTLEKEYFIRYWSDDFDKYEDGYPLAKGDKVQIKDKNGNPLTSYEYALGFDETNPNYDMATATYTAEGEGIYMMYYKLWKDGTYSMWIEIPKVGALSSADYFLCVNGKRVEKMSVSASVDNVTFPTLVKEFYSKNVDLQVGDKVIIETNADSSVIPSNGILHWEKDNKVGANDGEPFKVPSSGKYNFYFKTWKNGGTSIWVEESKPVVTP